MGLETSKIEKQKSLERDWKIIQRFMFFCLVVLALAVLVGWLYFKVLVPFLVACFFAYLVSPIVDQLEKRKISRFFGVTFVMLIGLFFVGLLSTYGGSIMIDQIIGLVKKAPELIEVLTKSFFEKSSKLLAEFRLSERLSFESSFKEFNLVDQLLGRFQKAFDGLLSTGANVVSSVVNIIMIPFLTFVFVAEKPRLFELGRRVIPRDLKPYWKTTMGALDETLQAVVRGHVKVAIVLSFLYSVGFSLIGMSAGIAVGITAGMCRVIPYLDAVVGLVLGVTYVFSEGLPPVKIFAVVSVIGIVQVLDGALITPKLIGGKVGLHPAFVILTIIAAAYHLGFWGVLLAIPAAACCKALFLLVLPVYRDTDWYKGIR